MPGPLELQPAVFSILRGLVEARAGLRYSIDDHELFADKISPRARELGFDSLLDYYYFLRYDPGGQPELDALIETLLVHETYFFREAEQLTQLVDTFVAPLVASGARPRVWCAAASSGEEAYTLAMLLAQRQLLGQIELVASDLSRRMLTHAQEGVYSGRALRAIDGTIASQWLVPVGDKVEIVPALKEAIAWCQVNVVDATQVEALGKFDAILCRNALIYFGDQTTARVLRALTAALKSGGLLLVGAAESLIDYGTALACEQRAGSFFYRKTV